MTFHHRPQPRLAAEQTRELAHLQALRKAIGDRIERDLALLDALDTDSDLEPEEDDERECEPSLGWPENVDQEVRPGYGPGRPLHRDRALMRRFDPATLACGVDGRRCLHRTAADLEDDGDSGIADDGGLDEQQGLVVYGSAEDHLVDGVRRRHARSITGRFL